MTSSSTIKATLAAAMGAAIVAVAIVPAMAVPADQSKASEPSIPASVLAFNQKPAGNAVQISYAYLPEKGYVAIFADKDGKRGSEALGFTALDKGNHNNVKIDLASSVPAGTALWATLYKDVDGDKSLDLTKDKPLFPNGDPVENRFMIE